MVIWVWVWQEGIHLDDGVTLALVLDGRHEVVRQHISYHHQYAVGHQLRLEIRPRCHESVQTGVRQGRR